jgi:hypothetical protein
MKPFAAIAAALVITLAPVLALAQDAIREVRVQFPRGASSTTIKGTITGRETIDYKLGAAAGQRMTVTLTTDNTGNSFNLIEPGAGDVAYFVGSTSGNRYEGEIAQSGDQTIRVYLYRSAARRGETAHYRLKVAIAGAGHGQRPAHTTDAKVPGTDFNATGNIPCARAAGQPMGSCRFGVRREGGGAGSITVFWPDGGNRVIFFRNGAPSRYNESEADGGARMTVHREADLFRVRIGDQRFEIPEAALVGG